MYILPCLLILDLCFLAVQGTVSVVTLCNWVFTRCIREICAGCQSSVGQSNVAAARLVMEKPRFLTVCHLNRFCSRASKHN